MRPAEENRAAELSAGADVRPFAGPPLPRLVRRDALRRAAACERPHAAQRKNVGRTGAIRKRRTFCTVRGDRRFARSSEWLRKRRLFSETPVKLAHVAI